MSHKTIALTVGALALAIVMVSVGLVYTQRDDNQMASIPPQQDMLTTLDADNFNTYLGTAKPTIIDVRTPEEYAAGHIQGAVNIDFYASDFEARLQALDTKGTFAVYCRSGNRSGQTLERMRALGFTSVVNMGGGIVAWQETGKSVCTSTTC